MLILSPVGLSPAEQLAAQPDLSLGLPARPESAQYEYALIGRWSEADQVIQLAGVDQLPVETYAGFPAPALSADGLNIIPNEDGYWGGLFPLGTAPPTGLSGTARWIIHERVLVSIKPTIALRCRLARARKSTKTIYGRDFITAISPTAIFECRISLANYPDWQVAEALARLDDRMTAFTLYPAGLERAFLNGSVAPWRSPEFTSQCMVRSFTGWGGYDELDVAGATGTMRFVEVPHAQVVAEENLVPSEVVFDFLITEDERQLQTEAGGFILAS